jgi:fumarate hydratase class II
VKKAAALVNQAAGRLDYQRAEAIVVAADEVIAGKLDSEFPLHVWQTGSGTHWDMNVNEVISNRASQLLGGELGTKKPVHPNDHVNMGQSASDTFLTAMHIATLREVRQHTLPHLSELIDSVWIKAVEWAEVVEISRTQLQDATPLTLGQKWSAWATQLRDARRRLGITLDALHGRAAGDPAVGTRLNAPEGFAGRSRRSWPSSPACRCLPRRTGSPHRDRSTASSPCPPGCAASPWPYEDANDMRWRARARSRELELAANASGSLIMPGHATQPETMLMVCLQVIGEDSIVASAGAQESYFELNAMGPIIINSVLHSARILGDACEKLRRYGIEGTQLDTDGVSGHRPLADVCHRAGLRTDRS